MTSRGATVAGKVLALRKIFADRPELRTLEEQFRLLLHRRRTEIEASVVGIAILGPSGSGKTTAVARLISHTSGIVANDPNSPRADVVSFQVPSPATLKFIGQTALEALGYPLRRDRTEMIIWQMVRQHLQARQTLFLHLDEAQDLMRHQTPKMLQGVVRTLKSLMQTRDWPVGIILSGMPDLKDLLNHDPQLARRFYPIEFSRLHPDLDGDSIASLVRDYTDRGGICVSEMDVAFAARLIHAADGEFGLVIELVIAAIEEAFLADATTLTSAHFRAAFRRRSGCVDALNPFVAEDFERINTRLLLQSELLP
jgi:type II secretory pathway predicted ATPase ExeA